MPHWTIKALIAYGIIATIGVIIESLLHLRQRRQQQRRDQITIAAIDQAIHEILNDHNQPN